jgi:putative hydrolase of the HAD superfamily
VTRAVIFDFFGVLYRNIAGAEKQIDQDMLRFIQKCHGTYKTALLSNADSSLRIKLEELGLSSLFDKIILSKEVGVQKPDPKIFQLTLDLLYTKPEETIFIDDSAQNVATANSLGIKSIRFVSAPQLKNDLERLLIDNANPASTSP